MTLCIAAHARMGAQHRIVLCCDSMIGDDFGVKEAAIKCDPYVAPGLSTMYAGGVSDSEKLVRIIKHDLWARIPTEDSLESQLWMAMQKLRAQVVASGREDNNPPQVVVSGFVEGSPRIATVTGEGVFLNPDHSAIGAGAGHADTMLRWRQLSAHTWLLPAMYFVYEAKRIGETAPSVGKNVTTMFVLEPDVYPHRSRVFTVSAEGKNFLEQMFSRYGPKALPEDLLDDPSCLFYPTPEAQSDLQSTIADPSRPQPSQESPGESDER